MRFGPFEISLRQKAAVGVTDTSLLSRGWTRILEPWTGAWQRNIVGTTENVLSYAPVRACVGLIASDVGKLRIKLTEQTSLGVWEETAQTAKSPFLRVLEKPNRWQIRNKFLEQWMFSKLLSGNTYALKQRDQRGMVTTLTVLDPQRVKPYVSPDGSIWYALGQDNLAQIDSAKVVVPASEIAHDLMDHLYHPLCGVSPITACLSSSVQALRIQATSSEFFGNRAQPGGLLIAPGTISPETVKRLEQHWNTNYSGENAGKIAVVGDGLKYEAMTMNATDAQLVEQLKWTAHDVCTAFRVPPYMIGVGPAPTYNNIEALNAQYYAQCLQSHIEAIEMLLDDALGLPDNYGTEFDIPSLLRMDTATRMAVAEKAMTAGMSPNEVRLKFHGLGPVAGGDAPMMQSQNWTLEQLSQRSVAELSAAPRRQPDQADDADDDEDDEDKAIIEWHAKALALGVSA